jgi:hypothetical protein
LPAGQSRPCPLARSRVDAFTGRARTPRPPGPFYVLRATPGDHRLTAAARFRGVQVPVQDKPSQRAEVLGSRRDPHPGVRSEQASLAFTAPHLRAGLTPGGTTASTTILWSPFHVVLHSNCRRICPNQASLTCRARSWLPTIGGNERSSNHDSAVRPGQGGGARVDGRPCAGQRPCPPALPSAADAWRRRFDGGRGFVVAQSAGLPAGRGCEPAEQPSPRTAAVPALSKTSPVGRTARVLTPRSTPTTASGRDDVATGRWTSTVNEANQRPRTKTTAADITGPSPASTRLTSGGCVLAVPERTRDRGSVLTQVGRGDVEDPEAARQALLTTPERQLNLTHEHNS